MPKQKAEFFVTLNARRDDDTSCVFDRRFKNKKKATRFYESMNKCDILKGHLRLIRSDKPGIETTLQDRYNMGVLPDMRDHAEDIHTH